MKKTSCVKIISVLLVLLLVCIPLSVSGNEQDMIPEENPAAEYEMTGETEASVESADSFTEIPAQEPEIITEDIEEAEEEILPEEELTEAAEPEAEKPSGEEEFPAEEELLTEEVIPDTEGLPEEAAEAEILYEQEPEPEENDDPELYVTGSITWRIQNNTLYISGSGDMPDYGFETAPWYSSRSSICKAVIDNGITSIGAMAFWDCTGLTDITLPGSIRTIGEYAFMESGLKSITLNEGLVTIREGAFNSCRSLDSVMIPASVTGIGDYVFESCSALENIYVKSGNTAYSSINGVLCNVSGTVLSVYPAGKKDASYSIPASVKTIMPGAFSGNPYITSVVIPESVTVVPAKAFGSCTALTDITLPKALASVGSYAFYNCGSIKSLIIPKSVTSIGENAFIFCDSLEYIFYTGTNAQWKIINIDSTNEDVFNAVIVYDYTGKVNIGSASVLLSSASMMRTGKALTPVPTVTMNGRELARGVDYTVSYNNNIEAGTANVVITGKGRYTGTVNKTFSIYLKAPELVSVSNGRTGVKVTWDPVDGAGKYRVFRKTSNSSWTILGDTVSTSFTDETAVSNTAYKYTVRCITSDGSRYLSSYDKSGSWITYYAAPEISYINNYASGVAISWSAVSGVSRYVVYRKGSGESWKIIAVSSSNKYLDKTAESGKGYAYTIRCLSSNGKTVLSYYRAGKTIMRLAVPGLKSAVSSDNGITVRWTKVTGAQGYYVFRKTANGKWKAIARITSGSTLRYVDKKVKSGTGYIYTVRAYYGNYYSSYSSKGISAKAQ